LRVRPASLGWCAIAAVLSAGALLVQGTPGAALDWQPARIWTDPWRWWSAAWVHLSRLHLAANLAGAALVAGLGLVADVPMRGVVAWLAAWPLTHLALAIDPALAHYGGMSGVLHAAVAVIAVQLIFEGARARRWLGVALLAGLVVKVMMEAPWTGPVQHPPGWDIPIAPLAHATGTFIGAAAAALLFSVARTRRNRRA
jgi:rhomboid family GlyGly-CTERM serine protease